jgi:hypothetical protein
MKKESKEQSDLDAFAKELREMIIANHHAIEQAWERSYTMQAKLSKDLWDDETAAFYLGYSISTFKRRSITIAGFPEPHQMPRIDNKKERRWNAKEIKAWAFGETT